MILIFTVLAVFIVLSSCDGGTKTDTDDNGKNDNEFNDIEEDDKSDNLKNDESDVIPDEDTASSITIKCPESVDEEKVSSCEIIAGDNSTVVAEGDTCGGKIDDSFEPPLYVFTPKEHMGPGSCVVRVRDTVTDETAEDEITVLEVSTLPYFLSEFNEAIDFYEKTEKVIEVFYNDNDLPKESEKDPGYVTCSIRDNTCGFDLSIEKEFTKFILKGTMSEELSDRECEFKIVLTDGYGEESFQTVSAILHETNETPVWETEPVDITLTAGDSYNQINGVATDPDLPNSSEGDPGYLTCNLLSNHCSFDIAVETQRDENGKASCAMSFTSGDTVETCQFRFEVSDGNKKIYSQKTISVIPFVSIDCPESVNEGEEIVCNVSAKGGNPGVLDMTKNTCGGDVLNQEGSWKYRYTTTEEDGPKLCDAAVGIDTATAFATVEIKELNNPPEITFSSGCADPDNATATEGQNFFCNVIMSDADRPNSDTSDPGHVTCEIKNNTCGSWLTFTSNCNGSGKPDEESGGTECSYTVEITDGYGEKVSKNVSITIAEINDHPLMTVDPPSSKVLMTNETFMFTYSATDSDIPNSTDGDPGFLKCSASTTGINSEVTSTGEGGGSVTCSAQIKASALEECSSGCTVTFSVEDGYGSKRNTYTLLLVKKCVFFATEDGSGTGGRTWDDAFGTIQGAVDEAWEGCEIWVKQGTYTNPATDNSPVLTMKDGVKIIGGFQGYETYDHMNAGSRYRPENPIVHSVLDGEDMSYHVVVGALNKAALDGFVVTGGNAVGANDEEKRGGGMYNKASYAYFSDYFVSNTIFVDNYAEYGGGAVYNEDFYEDPTYFYNCQFQNNSSGDYGGAVLSINAGHITYLESEFSGNSSNAGGAISEKSSRSNLDKCIFKDNDSTTYGGALELSDLHTYELETQVFIVNSLFYDNSAGTLGGAISGGFEQLTIDHSTFANNSADSSSGAIIGTEATISNSIFWNNEIDNPEDRNITYSYGTGNTTGAGNINSIAPGSEMFVNEISDFHLHSTSPAIDAADPSSTVSDDIEGNPRPVVEPKDMGAYEY